MRLPPTLRAAVAAAALLATAGCANVITGTAVSGPHPPAAETAHPPPAKSDPCKHVSAPMTLIDPHDDGEPRLRIPQPPGWERASALDSDVIRFTMRNKELLADNFMPTAVVTLESVPIEAPDNHAIFEQERAALVDRLGATGLHSRATSLCGDDAELVDYDAPSMGRIPPRKVRTLMVAADFGGSTFVTTVTVQSTDPDNPVYSHDTDTVLTGFQMLPPAGG
jgi:hypothetical protein